MNEQTILPLVVFGGAIGLAIVGIALWMMRHDPSTKTETGPQAMPAPAEPAPPINDPAQPPSSIPPVESTPFAAADTSPQTPGPISSSPPPVAPSPVNAPSTSTPDWLNSVAAKPPEAPGPARADTELLRLWRSPNGDLVVEVNGRRYGSRLEVNEYTVGQQIANAASDLNSFLNSFAPGPIRAAPPTAPTPIVSAPPKTNEAQPKLPSFFAPPKIERPVVKVSLEEAAQMELKPPTMDISRQFRYLRDQQKKPEIQIKSVAEEIDEILQVTLIGTPLAGRGLKVSDGKHGAVFACDGHNYESVDQIPDPAAREAVRAAIQKWDQK